MEQERIKNAFGKLVYREPGDPPRAVRGWITEEADFYKIENSKGLVIINKSIVIALRIPAAGEEAQR